MFDTLLLGIKIFFFIFAILIIVKDLYSFIKIIRLKEGKYNSTNLNSILLGSSISYVITMLIIGF